MMMTTPLGHGPASANPTPLASHTTVLVFLKSLATPVVLYTDKPQQLYEELKELMRHAHTARPKLIEKQTLGPLKLVAFWDTQLMGVALQGEP